MYQASTASDHGGDLGAAAPQALPGQPPVQGPDGVAAERCSSCTASPRLDARGRMTSHT
jgi:hypothetical protein